MENESFAQGTEIGEQDPFAGSDFGDWEQEQQPENASQPVNPGGVLTQDDIDEAGYDGPVASEGEVSPAHPAHPANQPPEAAPAPPSPPPPPDTPPEAGADAPQTAAEAAPAAPQAPATPSDGVQPPPEPEIAAEQARREAEGDVPIDTEGLPEPEDPTSSSDSSSEPEEESSSPEPEEVAPSPPADPGDAPVPDETKDKRGRVTHRRYVILRHDGKGKFTQLDWHEDKKHNIVAENANNAKRQTVVLARGTEDALKFGFIVSGGPQNGVDLVAVAAAYFQTKHVAPLPPEPTKQRLQIN